MKECNILGGQNILWPLLHILRVKTTNPKDIGYSKENLKIGKFKNTHGDPLPSLPSLPYRPLPFFPSHCLPLPLPFPIPSYIPFP